MLVKNKVDAVSAEVKLEIAALVRLFLVIAKADAEITTKESGQIARLLIQKFQHRGSCVDYIINEIEQSLADPVDESAVVKLIQDIYPRKDQQNILYDILSLIYIDEADSEGREINAYLKIAALLQIETKEARDLIDLFNCKFDIARGNTSILTIGGLASGADICFGFFTGLLFFKEFEGDLRLIVINPDQLNLNGRNCNKYMAVPFMENDRLFIKEYDFEMDEIVNLMNAKLHQKEVLYYLFSSEEHSSELDITREKPNRFIANLVHCGHRITITPNEKNHRFIIDGEEITIDKSMSIYDREIIYVDNYSNGILLDVSERTSLFNDQKEKGRKTKIFSLSVQNVSSVFRDNTKALDHINFSLESGELAAILGPAGAGKSTLFNALLGTQKLTEGNILINNVPLVHGLLDVRDLLGFVPQDDLLFEVLTVRENLYYKFKLKYPEKVKTDKEINNYIYKMLKKVGLHEKMNSQVGSLEQRRLSGGERKRLNIALELINEPDILFLDEPTTGLSSQDAEEIIKTLKRISQDGTIVLMVIHQPSSTIYKMIDKAIILNKGGSLAFAGDAIQALVYFRDVVESSNTDESNSYVECPTCRAVNPDLLMKSLKSESTGFWKLVQKMVNVSQNKSVKVIKREVGPEKILKPKTRKFSEISKQNFSQFRRLFLCKFRDKINLLVTFLVAPILSMMTAWLLRFNPSSDPTSVYHFETNTQYPVFLFLIVIVAIFFGLSNSAAEVIKDRLTLKRESLINISFFGYLVSKFIVLVFFSLIQNILYILPAHLILEEYNMICVHIGLMTIVSSAGISFGLFISTFLRSATAAYNLVPLILVPQIVLGGALVEYKDLNRDIYYNRDALIPEIANGMLSRWGYEMIFTANYSLHPFNRLANEEQQEKKKLDELGMAGKLTIDQKIVLKDELSAKYQILRDEAINSLNPEIQKANILGKDKYLSPDNSWFEGILPTWLRNVFMLISYSLGLLIFGFIRILRIKI